ncbi:ABC transporter ATP-binding protein [Synechococcus sp. CBW1004]|uniref:ABC transporter ATP-binding protein n=1 Tax=Synechococcus sp. CBW1004 TaxID=1353136 RepID=UPI001E3625CF|nr:ABC transporter ATP-binding protein [Synechococcus sp. CBW1004]
MLLSSVLLALCEGLTFGVIFQAARLLSGGAATGAMAMPGRMGLPLGSLSTLPLGQRFALLLALAVLLQGLTSLFNYINGVSAGWFAARCEREVAPAIHRHLLSLSYGCVSRYPVGDLVNRCTLAPVAVQRQLQEWAQVLSNLLLVGVYLAVLILLTPLLSLVAVAMAAAIALLQSQLRPRIRTASKQLAEAGRRMASAITEDIQILRLLHSTAGITRAIKRQEQSAVQQERQMRRMGLLVPVLEPVSDLLPVLAAALIGLLSWHLFEGQQSLMVPNLVVFVLVLQRLNLRLTRTAGCLNRMAEMHGSLQLVEELLDPAGKQFRRRGGVPFAGLRQRIRLEGVSLTYAGRHQPALDGIDLEIPAGSTVALVGESGGGKSSLVDLLVGLISPSGGRILLDGVDLETIDLDSWQQKLGVVSQELLLLNGSIRDNIAFSVPHAGEEAIRAAAEAADAAAFIEALPEGYDTLIGERGFRLSGGQRQRLCLARALLQDPEILILDEATSALDSPTEARILEAVERFAHNRTVLTVAHRLSSVVHADQILVLGGGHIVERGRHDELLGLQGIYAALWRQQANTNRANTRQMPEITRK